MLFPAVVSRVYKGVSEESMLENPTTNPKQVTQILMDGTGISFQEKTLVPAGP